MRIGIDIGSTTVKTVVLSDTGETLFHAYERHYSMVRKKAAEQLRVLLPRLQGQSKTQKSFG